MMPDGPRHASNLRERQRRALRLALVINAAVLGVEVVGGVVFHSLALLADAAHMLSDVGGLGIALVAQSLVERPSTARHSYGLQRAEVLGAHANGLILVAAAAWIVWEAIARLQEPIQVAGGGVLAVATLGLAANLASAAALARAGGSSLNMRGALLHMLMDALGSIGALLSGAAVLLWGAAWVDPLASILIGFLVMASAWKLLREATHVLMEGTPRGLHAAEIAQALEAQPGVEAVHHVHLWNLASDVPALSAHVVLAEDTSLHDAQITGELLKAALRKRFGIAHATLELECHACEPASTAARAH